MLTELSSRIKQVILPLWLIGGEPVKDILTSMARSFDNRLKIEDPDCLLELQAKDAIKEIVDKVESGDESVNIRNLVNVLYEAPNQPFYEVTLSLISKTILTQRETG